MPEGGALGGRASVSQERLLEMIDSSVARMNEVVLLHCKPLPRSCQLSLPESFGRSHSSSETLWNAAVDQLSEADKKEIIIKDRHELDILSDLYYFTKKQQQACLAKQWTFKRPGGKIVIVRDLLGKMLKCVNHYKAVGDIAVQFNTKAASLPWAAFRFLLQAGTLQYEDIKKDWDDIVHVQEDIGELCALVMGEGEQYLSSRALWRPLGLITFHLDIIDQISEIKTQLDTFNRPLTRWDDTMEKVDDGLKKSERLNILRWLSKEPYIQYHNRNKEGFLHGTGSWLLNHPVYTQWKDESTNSILWLHEDFSRDFADKTCPRPVYYYCSGDAAESARSNPAAILASIVRQLCCTSPGEPLLEPVVREYNNHDDPDAVGQLLLDDIHRLLVELIGCYPAVTIIIDALDEVEPTTGFKLLDALTSVLELPVLVKIFISSRDDPDIANRLQDFSNIEISPENNSSDIRLVVEARSRELIRTKPSLFLVEESDGNPVRTMIIDRLTEGAKGMFIWAELQLLAITEMNTKAEVIRRLGTLPKTLEALYREIFETIEKKCTESVDHEYAQITLSLLLHCHEQLKLSAFLDAVSIYPPSLRGKGNTAFVSKEQILKLCGKLVVFDSELDTFRFLHISAQEFLHRQEAYSVPISNSRIAQACLLCLNDRIPVESGTECEDWHLSQASSVIDLDYDENCNRQDNGKARLDDPNSFEHFAIYSWQHYAQVANTTQECRDGVKDLLSIFFFGFTAGNSPFSLWETEFLKTGKPRGYNSPIYHDDICVPHHKLNAVATDQIERGQVICGLTNKQTLGLHLGLSSRSITLVKELLSRAHIEATETEVVEIAMFHEGRITSDSQYKQDMRDTGITEEIVLDALNALRNRKRSMPFFDRATYPEKLTRTRYTTEELMVYLLERERVKLGEENAYLIMKYFGMRVVSSLLEHKDEVKITPRAIQAAVANLCYGREVLPLFLEKEQDIHITEEVLVEAARNWRSGTQIFQLILDKQKPLPITLRVVQDVIQNEDQAHHILRMLLEKKKEIPTSEELLTELMGQFKGWQILKLLLEQENAIPITIGMVISASSNEPYGFDILSLFFQKNKNIPITEEVWIRASRNLVSGAEIVKLLLKERGRTSITAKMVEAAVANFRHGEKILSYFLDKQAHVPITAVALRSALWNHCGVLQVEPQPNKLYTQCPEWVAEFGRSMTKMLLSRANTRLKKENAQSLYFCAAILGDESVLQHLEDYLVPANPSLSTKHYYSAAKFRAMLLYDEQQAAQFLNRVLESAADAQILKILLCVAILSARYSLVKILVESDQVDLKEIYAEKCLPVSLSNYLDDRILKLLQKAGADPFLEDGHGENGISMPRRRALEWLN
ncbi:hypothetical protein FQN57_001350 [Myotisia sp. PD_48]|nr:hypothetical protein FQN57_001350 [Myotisia sp. PD_48]